MVRLFRHVDALLRGDLTRREDLERGDVGSRAGWLVAAVVVLGAVYGAFMGLHAALRAESPNYYQVASSALKVPALFLLTLAVTMPSLYVFSTIAGSRLGMPQTLRLLLCGIVVNLALLASFGPVTGFFTLSTESYPFMVVLNVVFFTLGGVAGLAFLGRALDAVFRPEAPAPAPEAVEVDFPPKETPPVGASRPPHSRAPSPARPQGRARLVFQVWVLIYAVVGAQMGWILRPFVGSPDLPPTFIRARESNFFEALGSAIRALFTGG